MRMRGYNVTLTLAEGPRADQAKACEEKGCRLDSPRDSAESTRLNSTHMDPNEETLILLKPDALERGLVGEVLGRFESAGLRIQNIRYVCPNLEKVETHYADLKTRNPRAFDRNTRYLAGKSAIAVVLSGVKAITKVRTLIGSTEPAAAPPGTIRGDLSSDTIALADAEDRGLFNLIHAADSPDSARREIEHWFQ